jgi:hypothetical protein
MTYRLVGDENVEHEVMFRLKNLGHNVEHVDFISMLGKGVTDDQTAQHSPCKERLMVKYNDFALDFEPADYQAVLYLPDLSASRRESRRLRRQQNCVLVARQTQPGDRA